MEEIGEMVEASAPPVDGFVAPNVLFAFDQPVVSELRNVEIEVAGLCVERVHAVQSRLHEVADQQVVEDPVVDGGHQAAPGCGEGDAAVPGTIETDREVAPADLEVQESKAAVQPLLP